MKIPYLATKYAVLYTLFIMAKKWGFNVRDMDTSVRPQDDFFRYVNGGWIKKTKIPENEARWGSFTMLRVASEKQLMSIVRDITKKPASRGSAEQMIRDFYRSGMDMARRNTLGLKPLFPLLKKISQLKSHEDLIPLVAELHRVGVGVLWDFDIDQDAKNSERYALYVGQGGLGMPDSDYYLKDDVESKRIRYAYQEYLAGVFHLMGKTSAEAKGARDIVMGIETKLAKVWMDKVARREIDKIYNKYSFAQFKKLAPTIHWEQYFRLVDVAPQKNLIVMQPKFMSALSKIMGETSIEEWKTYLSFHVVSDFSSALSSRFVQHSFRFYVQALAGTKRIKPLWRRVLGVVNGQLGELFGKIYVARYFPEEAKRKVNEIVDDLFLAYEERIKTLDWMGPQTKRKALAKLARMSRKLGYPDTWRSYKGLQISATDYVGNIMHANVFEHLRQVKKLGKPIDRTEWLMTPQTVNACFQPTMNEITFPAGILQWPFFRLGDDDALNYGGMGGVIGHEITHGFDDEGAKFDGRGNLSLWWTPEDKKRFEKRGKILEKQYDQYALHGVSVNGKLTLGENIADMGGWSIAFDAFKKRLEKTGRKNINGFTPEQRFFISAAKSECEIKRPEFVKLMMLTDPHSPSEFRVNGSFLNLPEFHEAFNVKPGDKMYRAPKDRAKIW